MSSVMCEHLTYSIEYVSLVHGGEGNILNLLNVRKYNFQIFMC